MTTTHTCQQCGITYEPEPFGDRSLCWPCHCTQTQTDNESRLRRSAPGREPPSHGTMRS